MESLPPYAIVLFGIGAVVSLKMFDSKAGRSLMLLGLVASFGWRQLAHKPHTRPFSSNDVITSAERTIDETGRISVRPAGSQAHLFQHFQTQGAASLTALEQLNSSEWVAVFSANSPAGKAPALENRYRGWFETTMNDSNETLPLVKSHKAVGGDIRIEDASSGETLFVYQANAAFKPVAIVKQSQRPLGQSWQVVFSNQPGLLSQKR